MFVSYEALDRENVTDGDCASITCRPCSAHMGGEIKEVNGHEEAEKFITDNELKYEPRGNCKHFRRLPLNCRQRYADRPPVLIN